MSSTSNRTPGSFRFTVTLTVGLLSFLGAAILVLLYQLYPEQRQLLNYVIAAAASAGGITSAYYLAASVREAVRTQRQAVESQDAFRVQQEAAHKEILATNAVAARIQRTAELSGRWGDPAFVPARRTFARIRDQLKHSKIGPDARIQLIEQAIEEREESLADTPNTKRSIVMVLDFIEEVCLAVNMSTADEEAVRRLWKTAIIQYWDLFGEWIKERRQKTNQPRLYVELESRANVWRQN
jgi:hypothetical protein